MLKKALGIVAIIALLILAVRIVLAEASVLMPGHQVSPGAVYWHTDSLKIVSVGWLDRTGDTIVVIQHLITKGKLTAPDGITFIPMKQIDSLVSLRPVQKADLRRGD